MLYLYSHEEDPPSSFPSPFLFDLPDSDPIDVASYSMIVVSSSVVAMVVSMGRHSAGGRGGTSSGAYGPH